MSAEEVAFYRRHGAVVLRNVISDRELSLLRSGIAEVLERPSERANGGKFFEDFNRWPDVEPLEAFVRKTRLARIGSCLMGSSTAQLYHDHILVKESGTSSMTPRHQDLPYYDVEGEQFVSFWIPTEPVDEATCLEVVSGTHLGPWYMPRTFKTLEAKWFPEGSLPDCPVEGGSILRWSLNPGDAIAFHFLAVHGAPGVLTTASRRPVYSLRLMGGDCVYAPRPWVPSPDLGPLLAAPRTTITPLSPPRIPGSPLVGPLFPILYTTPVDVTRYPILGSPSRLAGLIARLRADYLSTGACVLPAFLTPVALSSALAEVRGALASVFFCRNGHNVFSVVIPLYPPPTLGIIAYARR